MRYLIRYLIGTKNFGLRIEKGVGCANLCTYSDADWKRVKEFRKSHSGIVVLLTGTPLVCSSKNKTTTALLNSESEFISLSSCVQNVAWARAVLAERAFGDKQPTVVYQDNLGALIGLQTRASACKTN